jgi:PAS domain S-box-containing protein
MPVLEQETISRIKTLLKVHPKGLTITDISTKLKMNRNSAAKYLEILQISGLVESESYGTARVFFLSHRLPVSALVSIGSDLLVTLDDNHRILFVNEGFCHLFAVKKEEVQGRHIVDIFKTGIGSDVLPEIFSDIIAGKEEVREIRLSRENGDLFFKIKNMKTVFDDGSRGITIIMEDLTQEKKARIELEAKEARYRGIVEDQIEYVVRFLPDGTLTFVNTSFCHFLKKNPDTLLGTPYLDTIIPKDRSEVERCRAAIDQDNRVVSFECRPAVTPGPVRWIAWTLRAMYDGGREPVEYQAVGHDITEEKEKREQIGRHLTQMEFFSAKLQQFIELPPGADIYLTIGTGFSEIIPIAAICVSCYDPKTATLTIKAVCNEHDRDVFSQYIGRDIIGLKIPIGDAPPSADFLSGRIYTRQKNLYDIIRHKVPEDICAAIEGALNLVKFYSIGLIWQGALLGNVTFALRKGEQLENVSIAETYIRAASIALQRSLAEDALSRSEKMYRSVLDNIQDVFYRSDIDGNLIMVSPSGVSMLGYSTMEETKGKNIGRDFYLEPEKRKNFLAAINGEGSVSNYEVMLKKKDGTPLPIETNSHFYYDKDGTLLGVEGIFRNISERKAAEKKIHQYIGEIEFLSQKLLDFIMMEPSENIYGKILADFKTLVPDSMILVNSFDPHTSKVRVESVLMKEPQREALFRALGRDLAGCEFPIDEAGRSAFETGRLQQGDPSLFKIVFRSIPEPVCDQLEAELEIGEKYAIGFVRSGEIMGNTAFFIDRGKTIPDKKMVEMYAREAAIALQRHIAEEAKRKSDEIFLNITQYSPFPIAIIKPDKTFQYVNESFIRLFGYDLNDFHTVDEWFRLALPDPVYRKEIYEVWKSEQENYQPGYTFTKTCHIHCKDSTVKEIVVRIVVLSGEISCVIGEDTTDRTRGEQTRRLLSSIIASSSDAVIAKDNGGTILSWNKAAERLYGYAEDEIIGQSISRIIPAERTGEMEKIFSRIERGESVSNFETRRIRKDGRFVDVSVTVSPIMDDAGTVAGASTIARDITRHKAEERLQENEEQYRSLVENISVGFYRSTGDPMGRFIWGNSSLVRILGYPSFEQLSGVGIADIFVEQDGRKRLLDDLKKEGFVKNREIALWKADGKPINVLVTALARFDPGGDVSCINGVVQDITDQKQAEDRVQIVVKQMQDILAYVPYPVVITDHENCVIAWNAAMEQLTGAQKTEVIGRKDYDQYFPFYDPARPALVTLFDAEGGDLDRYYAGAYRQGTTIIAREQDRVHGKENPVCFTVRASPLCDPQGARIGAVQIIQPAAPGGRTGIL